MFFSSFDMDQQAKRNFYQPLVPLAASFALFLSSGDFIFVIYCWFVSLHKVEELSVYHPLCFAGILHVHY